MGSSRKAMNQQQKSVLQFSSPCGGKKSKRKKKKDLPPSDAPSGICSSNSCIYSKCLTLWVVLHNETAK